MASDYWEPLIPFLSTTTTTTTNSNNSNQISYESHLISSHHIPFLELLQCAIQQKEELDDQEQHQPLESCITNTTTPSASRKKRKRSRPTTCCKSPEEVESQRMTHIAVERNRRRLMNHHLASLRSLMPSSYVQRVCMHACVHAFIHSFIVFLNLLSLASSQCLHPHIYIYIYIFIIAG